MLWPLYSDVTFVNDVLPLVLLKVHLYEKSQDSLGNDMRSTWTPMVSQKIEGKGDS